MNIDYIRERVIIALADHSDATKGQLAAFEEHAPADTASKKRKRIHYVQLDKRRRVSAAIDPVSCTETRSRVKPSPPIHEITFCSSSWRRAVSSMEGEQLAWIRYCYGYDLAYSHQVTICQHIWAEFEKRCTGKKVTAKKRARLSSLVWLAVQTYASKETGRIANEYSAGDLAGLSGVSKSNWAVNYAAQWGELIKLCGELDFSSLILLLSCRINLKIKNGTM